MYENETNSEIVSEIERSYNEVRGNEMAVVGHIFKRLKSFQD
jgi:hypothetical protein